MLSDLMIQARVTTGEQRQLVLEEISDVLIRGKWDPIEASMAVGSLVQMCVAEQDPVTLEILLNDISTALYSGVPLRTDLSPLLGILDGLEPSLLDYALNILAQSRDARYRATFERFLADPREEVRESAQAALEELTSA